MKLNFSIFIIIIFMLLNPSLSFSGDINKGNKIAKQVCSACHGVDGIATTGGNSAITPNITGQQQTYLIAKLKNYKSGKINHPQMSLIAQMLSDDDIENVAEWYSSIKIVIELPTLK